MKILQVTLAFVPSKFVGIRAVSYTLSKTLAKRGHEVTVYTTDADIGYSRSKDVHDTRNVDGIPNVLNTENGVKFLVGGDGEFRGEVEEFLNKGSLKGKVEFVGWIPHDEIPKYLKQLKLLALSSYTEGLPNIMLEAMACGTIVLATPVGSIPDVIKDGETGLIMEDNSPECIAQNIIRTLNHPNLEQIARNARVFVEGEFTYERAVERYRKILEGLL